MPIRIVDIVVGGIYATENNQERRVTKIEYGKVTTNRVAETSKTNGATVIPYPNRQA